MAFLLHADISVMISQNGNRLLIPLDHDLKTQVSIPFYFLKYTQMFQKWCLLFSGCYGVLNYSIELIFQCSRKIAALVPDILLNQPLPRLGKMELQFILYLAGKKTQVS